MSTFSELRLIPHATKRTLIVRLDEDFKISILENARNLHYNFTGLDVDNGQQLDGANVTDPIAYVRGIKEGRDSRLIIGVNCYYEEDNQTIPNAGIYYYSTKDHFDYEEILQIAKGETTAGKTKAPDPRFTNPVQTFPTEIFNIAPDGTTLSPNTATPPTAVSQRLYAQLGTTENRRQYLKQLLRANHLDDSDQILKSMNFYLSLGTSTEDPTLNRDYLVGQQGYRAWLQLIANVISLDANLNTEQKFNLLAGELSINLLDIAQNGLDSGLRDRIMNGNNNPANWRFTRWGRIASSSPWNYSAPDFLSGFNKTLEPLIVLTGANLGNNWINWVRS